MEALVKEYQKRFRKVREEMDQWDLLQSQLLSLFGNAISIIKRLQLIQDPNSYGALECVEGVRDAVLGKQLESLDSIFLSMNQTLEELHDVVKFLEWTHRCTRQWVNKLTTKQLDQQVGLKPCLRYCSDSLMLLHEMHQSEYLLKSSVVSALSVLTLKPSRGGRGLQVQHPESDDDSDLMALQQLLIDQPNIPKEEAFYRTNTNMIDASEKLCTMEVDSNNKLPWSKKQSVVLVSREPLVPFMQRHRQCAVQSKSKCLNSYRCATNLLKEMQVLSAWTSIMLSFKMDFPYFVILSKYLRVLFDDLPSIEVTV